MYQDYIVGQHKANKGKRFLNFIIDYVFMLIIVYVIAVILGIFFAITDPENTFFDDLENMNPVFR